MKNSNQIKLLFHALFEVENCPEIQNTIPEEIIICSEDSNVLYDPNDLHFLVKKVINLANNLFTPLVGNPMDETFQWDFEVIKQVKKLGIPIVYVAANDSDFDHIEIYTLKGLIVCGRF